MFKYVCNLLGLVFLFYLEINKNIVNKWVKKKKKKLQCYDNQIIFEYQ